MGFVANFVLFLDIKQFEDRLSFGQLTASYTLYVCFFGGGFGGTQDMLLCDAAVPQIVTPSV